MTRTENQPQSSETQHICGMCHKNMCQGVGLCLECQTKWDDIIKPKQCIRCGKRDMFIEHGICFSCYLHIRKVWEQDTINEYKEHHWPDKVKRLRKAVEWAMQERYKNCAICGNRSMLENHHITYPNEGQEETVLLCWVCHRAQPGKKYSPDARRDILHLCQKEFQTDESFPKSSP